jgi:ABC-2 type transport system ATP-binding protein
VNVLELNRVTKSFGAVKAVNNIDLSLEKGMVCGYLGPNGAGKTTTIRMIMGIIMPDSGDIKIFDQNNTLKIRNRIGYLPEERGLYKKMTVMDTLLFFAEIKSEKPKNIRYKAKSWLEKLDLRDNQDNKIEELSRGMQQKLQFICTILHDPELVILDEPFSGLDPVSTNAIKDAILDLKRKGTTIIFSTHLMENAEKICDSICLINKGEKILDGKIKDIKSRFGENRIRISYNGQADFLVDKDLVNSFDDYGNYVEIIPSENALTQEILKKAVQQVQVTHFEVTTPSLNEIFINMVKQKT